MTVRLDWDDAGEVATLTIARPARHNALDRETLSELGARLEAVGEEARALVLTGAGEESFSAGADVEELARLSEADAHAYAALGAGVAAAIESCPAPSIAAINGHCYGGGLELALACDLRVASERATLGFTEIDLGIVPGWGGVARLQALVGDELARRLVYFGDRVDGTDAHEFGLVGEVVAHAELETYAATLGADLAAKPPLALRAAKETLDAAGGRDARAVARRSMAGLFGTDAQRDRMADFLGERDGGE
jgi:enoyl-CoA hydratase/carnithine racemase